MLTELNQENDPIDFKTIQQILNDLAALLPSQGPIDIFIHHNTLHGLEHLDFLTALETAAEIYDAKAYLDENKYLEYYFKNRIQEKDLDYILGKTHQGKNLSLFKKFLINAPVANTYQQIKWLLRESKFSISDNSETLESAVNWIKSDQLQHELRFLEKLNRQAASGLKGLLESCLKKGDHYQLIKEALWSRCLLSIIKNHHKAKKLTKKKDSLVAEQVNPFLIRFCEEYLDLGQATVAMPNRNLGILNCFYFLIEKSEFYLPNWLKPITERIKDYQSQTAAEIMISLLKKKNLNYSQARELIFEEVLSLKGWAGFISSAENHPQFLHQFASEVKPKLIEFVALRLILNDLALTWKAKNQLTLNDNFEISDLNRFNQLFQLSFHLFLVILDCKQTNKALAEQDYLEQISLQLISFPHQERQRIWQLAFEENLYQRALQALNSNSEIKDESLEVISQMIFCLDDREESLRRHIEKESPSIETFSTAGFFGVDAIYQSMNGEQAPFCPVVINPTHIIKQKPKENSNSKLVSLQKRQQINLYMNNYLARFSNSVWHGWLMTIIGIASLFPMIFSIIFPRLRKPFANFFDLDEKQTTALSNLEIIASETASDDSEISGYTEIEMAQRVASLLKTIGLIKNFSRLIIFFGHGSSSRNNPLRSAYDCGACGGRPGRMNARAIAMMINSVGVRKILKETFEINIPEHTFCIGAYHNTCNDQIEYYDTDLIPDSHTLFFVGIKDLMSKACQNNSLERCRRFAQVSADTPLAAYREVNARSQTLAEPRPEYGHAGNALCFIGRRVETKNLFLDRRAFLVSYDHRDDSKAIILANILRAIVPVCGGINLEYFFSALDNEVYGAGSKLPHNIVSMLGLMNGTCSDLRTGLPEQMIEIHEPVRLMIVVSCQLSQLQNAIMQDQTVRRMVEGQWVRLICWDSKKLKFFDYMPDRSFHERQVEKITLPVDENYLAKIINYSENIDFLKIR